jgi:hypothetical protein
VTKIVQLTKREQLELQQIKKNELENYKRKALKQFSEDKNQSIMLSQKANKIRNEIMVRVKFEQMKRGELRETMRKARAEIIDRR